jgi:hypothetical protein
VAGKAMKQKVQIFLVIAMVVAGVRLAWVFYQRHQEAAAPAKKEAPPLNPDYYVTPKKTYAYDLKTAKDLTKQPAWVKVGYAYSYFPYDRASRHADLEHEAGKLGPLQKLDIKDVVTGSFPKDKTRKQVLIVFDDGGKWHAAAIGTETAGDYKFYSDAMLFVQDPHELYKHWPPDVWQSIDAHQVKNGMSELQADFAIGIGLLEQGSDSIDRTLDYPNGGKPLKISFHDGKAIQISPGG